MAVTKVEFTGTQYSSENYNEVYNFLRTYAYPTYFSNVTTSNGYVNCYLKRDGNDFQVLSLFCGNRSNTLGLLNSTYAYTPDTGFWFRRGYVTDKGIYLQGENPFYDLIISKNEDGDTVFVALCDITSGPSTTGTYYWYVDPKNTSSFDSARMYGPVSGTANKYTVASKSAAATALAPIVLPEGKICEDILVATQSQSVGYVGEVVLNGVTYVSQGALWLKDG